MRICVTSEGPTLDSKVDARFGRGRYFIFIDTDTMNYEAIENLGVNAASGASIQAAQLVAQNGAKLVITGGNFGPKAAETLSSFGVEMIGEFSGTVREAVESFKRGELGNTSFSEAGAGPSYNQSPPDINSNELRERATKVSEDIKRAKDRVEKLIERK